MTRPLPVALALAALAGFALIAATASLAHADTLLVQRVQSEQGLALPARGLSMNQVQASYGAPTSKQEPRGGQKSQWPLINRWNYPTFTVYFEHNRVIDAVAAKSRPDEIGPKPAQVPIR